MNAVFGSILENLAAINIVEHPTADVFKKDKGNTANAREATVSQFIARYLPSDFQIRERTAIYSKDAASSNIDCVVLAPNHPQLITPIRQIALAEGVYAAVEVKPDISVLTDGSEFMRGLNQIKSVKNLTRTIEEVDISKLLNTPKKPEYFKKIPAVLFSFSSGSIEKTIEFVVEKIRNKQLTSEELPDLIVTLDKGVIYYTPHLSATPFAQQLIPEQKAIYGEKVFIHFAAAKQEMSLAIFLLLFLNLDPPTLLTHKFIIKDYLSQAELEYTSKFYAAEFTKESIHSLLKVLFDRMPNASTDQQS